MPAVLIHATNGPSDKAVREIRDNQQLTEHIAAREPHHLKTNQGPMPEAPSASSARPSDRRRR